PPVGAPPNGTLLAAGTECAGGRRWRWCDGDTAADLPARARPAGGVRRAVRRPVRPARATAGVPHLPDRVVVAARAAQAADRPGRRRAGRRRAGPRRAAAAVLPLRV